MGMSMSIDPSKLKKRRRKMRRGGKGQCGEESPCRG